MIQHEQDLAAGLNTAGFVSGYRGSPLGGLDQTCGRLARILLPDNIVFQPGINEDLAATAVWGCNRSISPKARYDGVYAMWYGKGPGSIAAGTCSVTAMRRAPPGMVGCS